MGWVGFGLGYTVGLERERDPIGRRERKASFRVMREGEKYKPRDWKFYTFELPAHKIFYFLKLKKKSELDVTCYKYILSHSLLRFVHALLQEG